MANYQQNRERSREGIDNCAHVANTDLVHTGTRNSNSNNYHYRESTPPSARHQQTTPALPKPEVMAICYSKNKHQQIEFRVQFTKSSLQSGHHILNASTNRYSENGRNLW